MSDFPPPVTSPTSARDTLGSLAGTAVKAWLSKVKFGPYILAAIAGSGLTLGGVTLIPPAESLPEPVTVVLPGGTNTVGLSAAITALVTQQRITDRAEAYERGERAGLALARRNAAQALADANRDGLQEGRADIRGLVSSMAEFDKGYTLTDVLREIDHFLDNGGAP